MSFDLPELPYPADALAPFISAATIDAHFGKLHRSYVENLNRFVAGTIFEESRLEEIMAAADGVLFNQAAEVWNHSFYWQCLSPQGGGDPKGALLEAIQAHFISIDAFRQEFTAAAIAHFGSGWTWLVKSAAGELAIVSTANAANPRCDGAIPLLACDVWEHAYSIDYRNARADYIDAFWKLVNWSYVESCFDAAEIQP